MFNLRKIKYFMLLSATSLLGFTVGLSSCVYDDEPLVVEPVDDPAAYVSIIIDAGDVGATRAAVETDEPGTGYENSIDPSHFEIALYNITNESTVGNQAGSFSQSFISMVNITECLYEGEGKYHVVGYLNNVPTGAFKIFVLANYAKGKDMPDLATTASSNNNNSVIWTICDAWYSYSDFGTVDAPYLPSAENPIPMYGVRDNHSGVYTFQKGKVTDIGTINLVRAFAKIEIISSDVSIESATLTKCYSTGMIAPGWMFAETVIPTDAMFNCPRFSTATGPTKNKNVDNYPKAVENLPFYKVDEKHYMIYIPEYVNNSSLTTYGGTNNGQFLATNGSGLVSNKVVIPTRIKLVIKEHDYYIDFVDYSAATSTVSTENMTKFNILRNHIYRFNVSMPNMLTIKYVVEPWAEYTAGDIAFD